MGRREEMLRKRDGDNWKASAALPARRLPGGGVVKAEPTSVAATGATSAKRATPAHRPWPKPPSRLVPEGKSQTAKAPIPIRTPHSVAGAGKAEAKSGGFATAAPAKPTEAPDMEVSQFTLVRAPRDESVEYNLLRFREGSEVSLDQMKQPVTMRKVEDEMDEQLEVSFPVSGAGAEFGKAQKEALRRRKYARKKERELDIRYHLEDRDGHHLLGEQQRELRGKLFLIKRRTNGTFEIAPVVHSWDFRRFKEKRGGAVDGEAADKTLKQHRPSGVSRFLKDGATLNPKSDKELLQESAGVKFEPTEIELSTTLTTKKGKEKKKPVVVATTRKVDLFDVDVDEEDWNAEIEFAPDDESKLGGLGAKMSVNEFTGEAFSLESSDDSSTEEEVDITGTSVVRRQRAQDDAEEEEAYLQVDDETPEDDKDDWTAEEQGPGAAPAAAAESKAATPSAAQKRKAGAAVGKPAPTADTAEAPAPSTKRRKVDPAAAGAAAKPTRNVHGLSLEIRKEIKLDLEKYLKRSSLKGITLAALLKKLKKKEYMKRQTNLVKEFLLKTLPEMAQPKKIEGEDRFVLKTLVHQLQD